MARKRRIWYPGAIYHVMSRGNRKDVIFKDDADYLFFLRHLTKVKREYPFCIHALCLMKNHFHIEMETSDVEIGKIMQKLLGGYAAYYNSRHSFRGHLFEGRFTSCLIEDEAYFLEVNRYIHLNPVKAKLVKEPTAFLYSSYDLYVSDAKECEKGTVKEIISGLVSTDRVLSAFGNDSGHYRLFVEGESPHVEQELLIMKDMAEDEMWLPK